MATKRKSVKAKKHQLSTLHGQVPNYIAYAVLIVLFLVAVKLVKTAVGINVPWEFYQ